MIKGYKVFNPDWTCRGFQYEVGKTYEEEIEPECCHIGFHFCEKAADCFNYYDFNPINKVAEVIALGDVDADEKKTCTNKIQIAREVSWMELLAIVNAGKGNTGLSNTGNCNTGDYNTGDWNAGDYNTGNRNAGDYNTGDWNIGDFNKSSFNSGCFNTLEFPMMLFNKPSDWTYYDWLNSEAKEILDNMPGKYTTWINSSDMADDEKEEYPSHETTGGYLKAGDETENRQKWFDELSEEEKNIIKAIPNFDDDVFFECTGIRV